MPEESMAIQVVVMGVPAAQVARDDTADQVVGWRNHGYASKTVDPLKGYWGRQRPICGLNSRDYGFHCPPKTVKFESMRRMDMARRALRSLKRSQKSGREGNRTSLKMRYGIDFVARENSV